MSNELRSPAWLRRRPLTLAAWFTAANALRSIAVHRVRTTLIVSSMLLALVAIVMIALTMRGQVAALWLTIVEYQFWIAAASAVHALFAVRKRRLAAQTAQRQSWLAAAPLSRRQVYGAVLARTLLPLIAQLVVLISVVLACGWFAGAAFDDVADVWGSVAAGFAAGAVPGWLWRRNAPAARFEDSRYAFGGNRHAATLAPSAAGLARWPIAQALAWHRPENVRVLLMFAMLMVMAGSSALHGICVVGTWLAAGYLSALVAATRRTANDAAQWLRATPIRFAGFAWTLARRPLAHQLVGTLAATVGLCALGAGVANALYLAALWLSIVTMLSLIWLADAYRGRSPAIKVAMSVAAVAGIESRGHGWAIPFALAVAAWHLRAGARR